MTTFSLPALRSNDAVGVLGALGVVEVATMALGLDLRLGWQGVGGSAVVSCADVGSVVDLAGRLAAIARSVHAEGGVVAGAPVDLVDAKIGSGVDPMKLPPEAVRNRLRRAQAEELEGVARARWLASLVNQLAVRRDPTTKEEICRFTPLYQGTGQQSLRQLYADALRACVEQPDELERAMLRWRRVTDYDGANLDHRAKRDAVAGAGRNVGNIGSPGVTWLALHAAPFFGLSGDGRSGEAVGWGRQGPTGWRRESSTTFRWPVWRPPLDHAGIGTLLSHPDLRLDLGMSGRSGAEPTRGRFPSRPDARREGGRRGEEAEHRRRVALDGRLHALGVVGVLDAERESLGKSLGPLGPARVVWPARQ